MDTDITIGSRFGSWTVIGHAATTRGGRRVQAQCDCGHVCEVFFRNIMRIKSPRCRGCFLAAPKKHGHTFHEVYSPTYGSWRAMRSRCEETKHRSYANYGGRGITICDRWLGEHGFENFLADMGERPAGMTLDRKDNDGDYSPENCQWATKRVQVRNSRNNHQLTHNGASRSIIEWAELLGIKASTIRSRLGYGWSVERTLTEPVHYEFGS